MLQQLIMGVGNLAQVDSADFDSTNDYMTRGAGLSGAADSKSGIFSCWFRLDGSNGTTLDILSSSTTLAGITQRMLVARDVGNTIAIRGLNSAGATILSLDTVGTFTAGAAWHHLLCSWDLAVGGASHLYIDGVSDKSVTTFTNDTLDYTLADWSVGAIPSGGSNLFDGPLAEVYFAPGQFLDFSVSANRRMFISPTGKPVQLGLTGSLPTGTAPIMYFHLAPGEAVADFATNRGTGGDFTITGTLTTGSTSPSN